MITVILSVVQLTVGERFTVLLCKFSCGCTLYSVYMQQSPFSSACFIHPFRDFRYNDLLNIMNEIQSHIGLEVCILFASNSNTLIPSRIISPGMIIYMDLLSKVSICAKSYYHMCVCNNLAYKQLLANNYLHKLFAELFSFNSKFYMEVCLPITINSYNF